MGRDAATMRTSVNALIGLDESTPPSGRAALSGSAQQLVDQLGRYAELGFAYFILPDRCLGPDHSERAGTLARIKAEVVDQLPA